MKKNKLFIILFLQIIAISTLCSVKYSGTLNYSPIIINNSGSSIFSKATNVSWSINGEVICNASGIQDTPQICSDGAGGAIITWRDERNDTGDIYVQRINAGGTVLWTVNGTVICPEDQIQQTPQIISDGVGGAIITWADNRVVTSDIYAQRINFKGVVQWTENGTVICAAGGNQITPQICSDGAGGAIITWEDYRSSNFDIYARRINASGDVLWATNGVPICVLAQNQHWVQICSDDAGGAVISWADFRSTFDYDVYAQRIDSSGNVNWTGNGIEISGGSNSQVFPKLCSDGKGGAIITWHDTTPPDNNIYAQRINSTGSVQWWSSGVPVCEAIGNQESPQICSDGTGGAVITWNDYRGISWDIFAQKINAQGGAPWMLSGIAICTEGGHQRFPQICSDGAGGVIITWEDERDGATNDDIYAQRVNVTGGIQWMPNGTAFCKAGNEQKTPQICCDGVGGAIITWEDEREGPTNSDIYVQKIAGEQEEPDNTMLLLLLAAASMGGGSNLLLNILNFLNILSIEEWLMVSFGGNIILTLALVITRKKK